MRWMRTDSFVWLIGALTVAMLVAVVIVLVLVPESGQLVPIIIGSVAPVVGALVVLLRLQGTDAKLDATNRQIDLTHQSINSKMDRLLQVSTDAARAEGRLGGIAEEVARAVEARAVEARAVEARAVEARAVEARAVESKEAMSFDRGRLPRLSDLEV